MSDAIEQFVLELKEVGRRKDPDEFQITGTLGKGKFACVYKAKSGDALYAVKKVQIFEMGSVMHIHTHTHTHIHTHTHTHTHTHAHTHTQVKSREKCLKEIKLLQQVSHENILQYKDSYIDPANEDLVIVLELAQGGDLKKLIRKVRHFTLILP
jgi:serine/threonine protein kinase